MWPKTALAFLVQNHYLLGHTSNHVDMLASTTIDASMEFECKNQSLHDGFMTTLMMVNSVGNTDYEAQH